MIVPYTVGPMALTGFTWFQGESNAGQPDVYACMFPAMINLWRKSFANPTAWFGFVHLEPWIGGA
jgi:sialate O-acetylesterase